MLICPPYAYSTRLLSARAPSVQAYLTVGLLCLAPELLCGGAFQAYLTVGLLCLCLSCCAAAPSKHTLLSACCACAWAAVRRLPSVPYCRPAVPGAWAAVRRLPSVPYCRPAVPGAWAAVWRLPNAAPADGEQLRRSSAALVSQTHRADTPAKRLTSQVAHDTSVMWLNTNNNHCQILIDEFMKFYNIYAYDHFNGMLSKSTLSSPQIRNLIKYIKN